MHQDSISVNCSVVLRDTRYGIFPHTFGYGGWVWLNCTAAGLGVEMPQCSLCVGECYWAESSEALKIEQSLWCWCLAFFVSVVVSCIRHSVDALMYWCMKLCFWLGAYVVTWRGVLWRWGLCIEAKFDDPRESLEKLYYFGGISRIIICMQA